MRVLVGGVGYRFLRDGSLGPHLTDKLADEPGEMSSNGLEIEDLSYGPVALSMNLQERPPYDRLVLFAAVERGRAPGTVEAYRWNRQLPAPDEIQERDLNAIRLQR